MIAAAASALSDKLLGFEAKAAWTIFFGILAAIFALVGPVGFVRRILRRFGVWIVLASLVYLSWWALSEADLSALWNAPGRGRLVVLARRRPRDRDHRLVGAARRRLHAASRATGGRRSGGLGSATSSARRGCSRSASSSSCREASPTPSTIPPAVAAGGLAAALALLAVTVDETDEAFANVYSAAVSRQNVVPEPPAGSDWRSRP